MAIERYEHSKKDKDQKYETFRGPIIPNSKNDLFTFSREGDRLDLLAQWWLIAEANNLGKGSLAVPTGLQLRIPQPDVNLQEGLLRAEEER